MSVTVDDLLDQLSEDDDRKPQLQIYFDTATA
ncbi:phage gp6-like head-tail connector protein, partial [Lactococcus cremoris]|nr:phage gp6-like head-tail connector protein [Lactococcus cremoris]MCT0452351.1 phage gp6-like head-tail connector protein [Lactococcus cremoris]